MVADIDPGNEPSNPRDLTVIGDAVWFRAWDGRHGCGIWRSDGTEAGTQNVAVLHTSWPYCYDTYTDGTPAGFIQINDTVFFVANTSELGRELWRSDGTAAGTNLVADINPNFEDADPRALTVLDGVLYFFADDGVAGYELWRSDGTADGTRRVRDINPGQGTASSPVGGPAGVGRRWRWSTGRCCSPVMTMSTASSCGAATERKTGRSCWSTPSRALRSRAWVSASPGQRRSRLWVATRSSSPCTRSTARPTHGLAE